MKFITVNHVCPDLIPERELTVTQLVFDDGIQVHYRITPGLPTDSGLQPFLHWEYDITDDLNTEYCDCGGSYAHVGESTVGMLCATPLPSDETRQLTIRLRPYQEEAGDLGDCTIQVMVERKEKEAAALTTQ